MKPVHKHVVKSNVALPFWSISKCSQRMSPTKSGARSRKRSFPIAHRVAPFMQNLSKSTFFRLNSFTVHVSHAATWFSVHCLGSEADQVCYFHSSSAVLCWFKRSPQPARPAVTLKRLLIITLCAATHSVVCAVVAARGSFITPATITPPLCGEDTPSTHNKSINSKQRGGGGCRSSSNDKLVCRYSMITQTHIQSPAASKQHKEALWSASI